MKRLLSLSIAAALLIGCGQLDEDTNKPSVLATIHGNLTNPSLVGVSNSVRVAVVWQVQGDVPYAFADRFDEEEQRMAVVAFVDGMSQEQIARETGWSKPTINKRLKDIRERAVRAMGDRHG